MALASSGTFVGRQAELDALAHALDDLVAGGSTGRFLLVTGEPGIGKTTLVERLIASAKGRGVEVGVGRAWEGAGAPPWWIWREALRSLGVELALPKTLANDEARFACLESVVEAVRELALSVPLVLVLDDLQWADVPSLLAIKLMARSLVRLPLLFVGIVREPARQTREVESLLVDLRREATTIALKSLSLEDVRALAIPRGLDDARAIDRALDVSGGNPLLVTWLLDDGDARRALTLGVSPPVPRGVVDVLARHLDQQDTALRSFLEWASVAGDPIDVPLVVAASGIAVDDAHAAIDDGRKAAVLANAAPARFAHDLLRSSTYASIDVARRKKMHLALGRALAGRPEAEMRVADHMFAADPDGASEETARAARAAATVAISRLAFEQAVVMAERAVVLDEQAGRTATLASTLALLSEARILAGDVVGSKAAAERALAIASAGSPEGRVEADAYGRAALALGLSRTMAMSEPALVAALEEALLRLDRSGLDDVALRSALEARLGSALQPAVDPPRALATARRAIERARSSRDPALLARTIHEARPAFRLLEPFEERLSLDSELLSHAHALRDVNLTTHAHGRLYWLALEAGDAIRADLHLAEYEGGARSVKVAHHELGAGCARAVRAAMSGDFDEALRVIDALDEDRARWAAASIQRMPANQLALVRANIDFLRGESTSIEIALLGAPPMIRPLFELVYDARQGRVEKAKNALAATASRFLVGEVGFLLRTYLAEVVVLVGDTTHAGRLFELLEPWSGRHVVGTPFPSYEGSADRLLAGLAALRGDTVRAEALYDAAIVAEEALGAAAFAARTRRERSLLVGAPPSSAGRLLAGAPASHRRGSATKPARVALVPVLAHEGDTWRVSYGDEDVRVKDAVGFHYIARLVAQPDVPVSAVELFQARALVLGDVGAKARTGDAGEILDPAAVAAYRARARDLREAVEEAEGRNDLGAVQSARSELDLLEEELRAAVGLGGRLRKAGSETERVRVSVTTRIRKAIDRLRERAPNAAHHLGTAIRTGTTCVYRSAPSR